MSAVGPEAPGDNSDFLKEFEAELEANSGQTIAWLSAETQTIAHRDPGPNVTKDYYFFNLGVLKSPAVLEKYIETHRLPLEANAVRLPLWNPLDDELSWDMDLRDILARGIADPEYVLEPEIFVGKTGKFVVFTDGRSVETPKPAIGNAAVEKLFDGYGLEENSKVVDAITALKETVAEPEKQKPERTRLDRARDDIVFGLTNTPSEIAGYPTTPSEHLEGVSFETKAFIVDTTIEALLKRGFIDPSAFREQTPEEAARALGVSEDTIKKWKQSGVLRDLVIARKVTSFRRGDTERLRKELWDDVIIEKLEGTLSKEEARALFDRHAQKKLGISGDEFMRRREAGEYDGQDTPEINRLEMLIPLWSPPPEDKAN